MEELDLMEKFCQPVVDDETMRNPLINIEMYRDLVGERNACQLCGWAKCGNPVLYHIGDPQIVFCSEQCQFMNQQFASSLVPEQNRGPIGNVTEIFAYQKPPKPLRALASDQIEGFRVRVGPYRHILNEIEKWFGGIRVMAFKGMNKEQTALLDLVNENLKEIGAALKKNGIDVVQFFVNIRVSDPKILTEAPKPVKMAFSLAVYEYLTRAEVVPALKNLDIHLALYEDMLQIIGQTDEGEEGFW